MTSLFEPLTIGSVRTANRVLMAPLTRMRAAGPGQVPNDLMLAYYTQRAGAGLVITEGTQISVEGQGYSQTPGIHSDEQVAAWRRITDSVHAADGLIACQLWHTGRVSHPDLHDGELPVSASALPFSSRTSLVTADGDVVRADCPTPRALETHEIPRLVEDYRRAAANAVAAGFDLVEVHAAHGYLLHQFLAEESNQRTDSYGGSVENRARVVLEIVDAIAAEIGADRVGIRISPIGRFNGLDSDDAEGGLYLARELSTRGIVFLHLSEPDWAGGPVLDDEFRTQLREAFDGVIIGAGAYDVAKAERLLDAGFIDAAAFGRPFIANPDLPKRLRTSAALNDPVAELFYGGGAAGYTDYPTLAETAPSGELAEAGQH